MTRRGVTFLVLLAGAAAAACAVYLFSLPDVEPLKSGNPATTAYIALREQEAARKGRPFHKRMVWVPWDDISDHLKHAVVVAEDDMFYRHAGVDWEAVRAALRKDWEAKRLVYGGSTITQQVARNLYLSPSKNPVRKLKEILIARKLEKTLGKRRILELYLNIAEWGQGIYGAEAAAQAYFGKPASDLDAEEAAALAAVLPNPRRWRPVGESRYVERNSRRLLARMRASGYLPEEAPAFLPFDLLVSTAPAPLLAVPASTGTP